MPSFDESSFMHGNNQESGGDTVTLCPPTLKREGDVYPLSPPGAAPLVEIVLVLPQTQRYYPNPLSIAPNSKILASPLI